MPRRAGGPDRARGSPRRAPEQRAGGDDAVGKRRSTETPKGKRRKEARRDNGTLPAGGRPGPYPGPEDAPATLIEHRGHECSYRREARPIVRKLVRRFGGRLCFVFRHFPLVGPHSQAERAAQGVEAATAQRRFREMHGRLFEHPDGLGDEDLSRHAEALRLDRFELEMGERLHEGRVREDLESGTRSGIPGPPAFFVNGEGYDRPHDLKSLSAALQAGLRGRDDRKQRAS